MVATLKLPVGIEDFKKIRRQGFYYIDKTRLIEQLLDRWGKVNLFIRPRRLVRPFYRLRLRKDSKFDTALTNEEDVLWN